MKILPLKKPSTTEESSAILVKLHGSDAVSRKIKNIFQQKITAQEKYPQIAKLISSHLSEHGFFAEDNGIGIFCLGTGQIYQIKAKDRTFSSFIFENYGICSAFHGFKILIGNLDNNDNDLEYICQGASGTIYAVDTFGASLWTKDVFSGTTVADLVEQGKNSQSNKITNFEI